MSSGEEANSSRQAMFREKLAMYCPSQQGKELVDQDAVDIAIAWYGAYMKPRGNRLALPPRLSPGQWYAPVRITETEIQGSSPGSTYCQIDGIRIASGPVEAILKAKQLIDKKPLSWSREIAGIEVLLSGPLKFDGQSNPQWIPVNDENYTTWQEIKDRRKN